MVKSNLKLIYEAKVDFDADLSHYGIQKGVLTNPDKGEIFAPVTMWLEAIDLVMSRLKEQGVNFAKVKGISGAGMQHGTVFWSKDADTLMGSLDPAKGLLEQLKPADKKEAGGVFSHPFSPNWQDASTQKQCEEFDKVLGSPKKLAEVTGSSAHHVSLSSCCWKICPLTRWNIQRYSGPQIMRFREQNPTAYAATARISLVSSFLASIFLAKVAPIDISDVCGTNLWDIPNASWNEQLLSLAGGGSSYAPLLKQKLGDVAQDGGKSLGTISRYFAQRYGFASECEVVPFTGDNPSTILALPLRASDAIVSLGTSTTFLMSTPNYIPDPSYHFMNHPTTPGLYMFMLCYKNGGLAREHIRDAVNGDESGTWDKFNDAARSSPPLDQRSNSDPMKLGLYFPRPEIVPNVKAGTWRFLYAPSTGELRETDAGSEEWPTPQTDARAIVESQFLSLRLRSRNLVTPRKDASGKDLPPQPRRIYLVGGGSLNPAIADVCGDVLGGAEGVYRLDIGGNACALGAAYKAVWGVERNKGESFEDLIGKRWDEAGFVREVNGGYRQEVWERYGDALKGFDEMEKRVVNIAGEGSIS